MCVSVPYGLRFVSCGPITMDVRKAQCYCCVLLLGLCRVETIGHLYFG
jgi:hypothetical protein